VSLWWWWHHSWLLHHGLGWHHIWVHHRLAHWHLLPHHRLAHWNLLPHHRLWWHHLLLLHHHRVHHGLLHHWLSHGLHHHRVLVHRLGHLLVHSCGCRRHSLFSLGYFGIWCIWIRLGIVNISSLNHCYLYWTVYTITNLTMRVSELSYQIIDKSVCNTTKDKSHNTANSRSSFWVRCWVVRQRGTRRITWRVLVFAEKIRSGTSFPFTSWWTVVYAAYFCRSWRGAIWRSTTGLVRR